MVALVAVPAVPPCVANAVTSGVSDDEVVIVGVEVAVPLGVGVTVLEAVIAGAMVVFIARGTITVGTNVTMAGDAEVESEVALAVAANTAGVALIVAACVALGTSTALVAAAVPLGTIALDGVILGVALAVATSVLKGAAFVVIVLTAVAAWVVAGSTTELVTAAVPMLVIDVAGAVVVAPDVAMAVETGVPSVAALVAGEVLAWAAASVAALVVTAGEVIVASRVGKALGRGWVAVAVDAAVGVGTGTGVLGI